MAETTEGFVQDNLPHPGPDSPPEAYTVQDVVSAEEIGETEEPFKITDKGFGATDDSPPEETEPTEESTESEEEIEAGPEEPPQSPDKSGKGEDSKESPPTEDSSELAKLKADFEVMKKKEEMLEWILKNPEQYAEKVKAQQEVKEARRLSLEFKDPALDRPIDELSEVERAEHWVRSGTINTLRDSLGPVVDSVNNLLVWKEQLEESLVRTAAAKDGTPLHPRWDELKPMVEQIQARYAGMPPHEAYMLAERYSPNVTESAEVSANPPPARPPAPPPPRRVNPRMTQASRVASLGRSPGGSPVTPKNLTAQEAAERALDQILEITE